MLNLGGGTKRGRPSSMESGGLSRGNPQGGTASWVLGECQDGQAERHKRHDFLEKKTRPSSTGEPLVQPKMAEKEEERTRDGMDRITDG